MKLNKEDEIYIIGHNNPDVDSIVSSKILSEVLRSEGYKTKYAVLEGERPNLSNMNMINLCMDYFPAIIKREDIKNYKYILVDHNNVSQSIDDASLVVGCFDHHKDTGSVKHPIISDYCCTALFIYDSFRENYKFSDEQKWQIFMAFLSDSKFSLSSRCKNEDLELVSELGFSDDYKSLMEKYFIGTNLSSEAIYAVNDYKHISNDKIELESTCIGRFDIDKIYEYSYFVQNYDGNFLGIWIDYSEEKTYSFLKYDNDFYVEVDKGVISRTEILKNVENRMNIKGKTKIKKYA